MGSANEAAADTSTASDSPPTIVPGTEKIASRLKEEGYEITYRPGRPAISADKSGSVAFIELHVVQDEVQQVENLLDDVDPTVPHRTIGPNDTRSLPDWPEANSPKTDNGTQQRPLYVIPSPHPAPTPEQKAQLRSSSL